MSAAVQPGLFDAPAERQRVLSRIGAAVLAFCRARLEQRGGEFHADDLRRAITAAALCAPASPDRILRALRQSGHLDYAVVDRRASLYRVTRVTR